MNDQLIAAVEGRDPALGAGLASTKDDHGASDRNKYLTL